MIQINFLAHNSRRILFSKKSLSFLKNINHKNDIKLFINYSHDDDIWKDFKNEMITCGISTDICYTCEGDYMGKIRNSVISECEYSCSMDDDIMLNEYLWDYICLLYTSPSPRD